MRQLVLEVVRIISIEVIIELTDRLDCKLPVDMEQILELMKSMEEELRTQGTKMEMVKAKQEEAETNRKADREV
jgi:predicted nucleic acid-binding protein